MILLYKGFLQYVTIVGTFIYMINSFVRATENFSFQTIDPAAAFDPPLTVPETFYGPLLTLYSRLL